MKKKLVMLFSGIAIVVLAATMLVGCQASTSSQPISQYQQTGIAVSGEGKVSVAPDVANVQLGINTQASTVAGAQALATKAMNDIIAALTDNGVAQKDIQTQYFNIQQTTVWDNVKQIQVVTGYQVNNVINVTIRDVTKAGSDIDAAAAAGGDYTRVNNVQFSIEDPTVYYDQARDKAMADAKDTATQLAKLSGVTLGKPISISQTANYVPPVTPVYAKDTAGAASSTPIVAGEQDITITVQVVYGIN